MCQAKFSIINILKNFNSELHVISLSLNIIRKMAEVASGYVVQSGTQPQDSSSYMNGNCVQRCFSG